MTSSILSASRELLRYRWERSVARSLPPRRVPELDRAAAELVAWARPEDPVLSVLIPTRDRLDLLVPCLTSLARTAARQPVEVLVGDTGSGPEARAFYRAAGLAVVGVEGAFNYSRACNALAAGARGERLLFLNNDTVAITPDWCRRLCSAGGDEVVGAALVYPRTRRLQHAGFAAAPARRGRGPCLRNLGLGRRVEDLEERASVLAVTGAFLSTTRDQFARLGGFDERYAVDLQDVDYCLRWRALGGEVVCRRDVVFCHNHAGSRGRYRVPAADWALFLDRWGAALERGARA